MSRIVATFFYSGLLKPAPGTWGSLAALPAFFALYVLGGTLLCILGIAVVFAAGLWAIRVETAQGDLKDPGWIVIDEVAGQWIALLPLAWGADFAGVGIGALWPGWIGAFLFFRLFDIWKPGPVGWADRKGGPMGVMLDDVIAGVFAAVTVVILGAIAHGLLV